MSEARLVTESVAKQKPAWLVSLMLAIWEVIKIELDAYLERLRR
jgi:hypothetical protein